MFACIYLCTFEQCAIKNQEKNEKLQTFDLSYIFGKNFFGYDDFQNMFVYQPAFSTLNVKENK